MLGLKNPLRGITMAMRGIGGEYELTRVVGFLGALSFIIGAHSFIAWTIAQGKEFDLTAYCIAFPGGLLTILGGIAGGAALKDRNIAVAKATEAKTKADAAGDGTRAIEEAAGDAAKQVADAATDEKDKITKGVVAGKKPVTEPEPSDGELPEEQKI